MKNIFSRLLGFLLVVIALTGVIICCVGIFGVWRFKSVAERETLEILDLATETADSALKGLDSTQTSLTAASDSMTDLDESLLAVSSTMESTGHFFDTAAKLTSDTFPNTIRTTQKAIQSAAQSAKLVDDTLSIIASIPLIGSDYAPDKPLSESLKDISASLDDLPGTIEGINDDIIQMKTNMTDMEAHLDDTKEQVERIQSSMQEAKDVIDKLNDTARKIQPKLTNLRTQTPRGFNILAWGLTIFLAWFALSQLGLIVQGLSMILAKPPV